MCTESKISANYIAKGVRQAKHAIGTQIEKKRKKKMAGWKGKETEIHFFFFNVAREKEKKKSWIFLLTSELEV